MHMRRHPALHRSRSVVSSGLLLALVLAVQPGGAIAAPHRHVAASPTAKSVVLNASDVTHIFGSRYKTRLSRGLSSREQTEYLTGGESVFSTMLEDWKSGYVTAFDRGGGLKSADIQSYVNIYKTKSFPVHLLKVNLANKSTIVRALAQVGVKETVKPYSQVGQAALLGTFETKVTHAGKKTIPKSYGFTLIFAQGHYVGTLSVSSQTKFHLADVQTAARLMESRMHGG